MAVTVAGLFLLGSVWRLAITNSSGRRRDLCLSLVVLTGFVGQISLAQMALAGVAGFTSPSWRPSTACRSRSGRSSAGAWPRCSGSLAAIPALRVRGVNLAVVTLAAAVAIENWCSRTRLAGDGRAPGVAARLPGMDFGPNNDPAQAVGFDGDGIPPNPWFGVFCLVVAVAPAPSSSPTCAARRPAGGCSPCGPTSGPPPRPGSTWPAQDPGLRARRLHRRPRRRAVRLPLRLGHAARRSVPRSLVFLAFAYLGGISSVLGCGDRRLLVAPDGVGFTALRQSFGIGASSRCSSAASG